MGLMDKFKNLFTEEIEEEVIEEPIKKEVIQVEIPSPTRRSSQDVLEKEEKKEEVEEPKKDDYKFPFFDDEDFNAMEVSEPVKPTKKKSSYRKEAYKKETKEVYSPVKEEKKVFKPTPIISPVYGILDKNYQKEDIKTKSDRPHNYYNPKEATVDEIRNKAYGTLEDDIETTLFGHNRALFEEEPVKKDEPNEELVETLNADDDVMSIIDDQPEVLSEDLIGERARHLSDEAELELTDLLEEEMGKEEVLEEKEEAPRKISDTELFDMIDSMYQKGDK